MKNIPTDWKRELLRAVCHRTEQWIPGKEPRGSFYYIDVSSVSNATYSLKDPVLVRADNAPGRARKILKWQDTIYATIRPSLKRVAFITKEYDGQIASTAFCVARPDKKMVFPLYVYFFLLSDFVNRKIVELQHGASYPAVTDKDVLNQTITLPPLPEQQKIAAILFKIQQAIEVQESIIERMQELKKATMQHVFTYGLRGEKTKETEIGRMPESWNLILISDLGEIITGTTPPTANSEYYEEGGYQFIAPIDLGKTTKIYKAAKEITESGLKVSRVLPKNSVCFVCIGSTIGKVGITVAEKATTNQQINTIITNDSFDPFFVTYLLDFKSDYIASFASPSPVPILSKGKFEEIQIMVSSDKQEQQEIAHVLQAIDQKIELHTAKKSALQDLFKTMLNKLMTGEIRVRDLEVNTDF